MRDNKGFTLIEILVAIAIIVMMSTLTITTISTIAATRMKANTERVKAEFELTRNFAKTHGGNATYYIQKTVDGLQIRRESTVVTKMEEDLVDKNLELFYKVTDDDTIYQLGTTDHADVTDSTIEMTFRQTSGEIIGPNMLDYIVLSNGSKNYKLMIKQSTGMMYYDYEVDENEMENKKNEDVETIALPLFIEKGTFVKNRNKVLEIKVDKDGKTIQPDIKYDSKNIKIGGVYRAKDVTDANYVITFELKNEYVTKWEDGSTGTQYLYWRIVP